MSIYDVFNNSSAGTYNKEEWIAHKQAERQRAYDLIETTCSKMMDNGAVFQKYLDVQGRFDRYSVNNAILVSAQKPDATQLKDYSKWKDSRVYIKPDEKHITILEPGKEYTRDDGTKAVSYNAKAVFDISQTSSKQKDAVKQPIRNMVSALIDASPVAFHPVNDLELPAFYDADQQTIFVRTGLTEEQLFASMAKEVSAAVYGMKYGNHDVDFRSYCVAYMLCKKFDVDTRDFDFAKAPEGYKDMDIPNFKNELNTMRDVLGEIQRDMYQSLEKKKSAKSNEQVR